MSKYSFQRLVKIFKKTEGCCHVCKKKIDFKLYAKLHHKNGWQIVDRSRTEASGGNSAITNLWPVHAQCKLGQRTGKSRNARKAQEYSHSSTEKRIQKDRREIVGGLVGGTLGLAAGPAGVVAGAALGVEIGRKILRRKKHSASK